jgi:hypothetical protein
MKWDIKLLDILGRSRGRRSQARCIKTMMGKRKYWIERINSVFVLFCPAATHRLYYERRLEFISQGAPSGNASIKLRAYLRGSN